MRLLLASTWGPLGLVKFRPLSVDECLLVNVLGFGAYGTVYWPETAAHVGAVPVVSGYVGERAAEWANDCFDQLSMMHVARLSALAGSNMF